MVDTVGGKFEWRWGTGGRSSAGMIPASQFYTGARIAITPKHACPVACGVEHAVVIYKQPPLIVVEVVVRRVACIRTVLGECCFNFCRWDSCKECFCETGHGA